jgi:hypothetical protein
LGVAVASSQAAGVGDGHKILLGARRFAGVWLVWVGMCGIDALFKFGSIVMGTLFMAKLHALVGKTHRPQGFIVTAGLFNGY